VASRWTGSCPDQGDRSALQHLEDGVERVDVAAPMVAVDQGLGGEPGPDAVLGLSTRLTTRVFEDRGADGERALQFGVTYRGGPLAPAGSGAGLQAGDRAPDAPLRDAAGAPVTLLDLRRGPHWTLLGFGTHPARPVGPVRVVGIDAAGVAASATRTVTRGRPTARSTASWCSSGRTGTSGSAVPTKWRSGTTLRPSCRPGTSPGWAGHEPGTCCCRIG
jgi:hypothetical protein